jgi:hypothetical protein
MRPAMAKPVEYIPFVRGERSRLQVPLRRRPSEQGKRAERPTACHGCEDFRDYLRISAAGQPRPSAPPSARSAVAVLPASALACGAAAGAMNCGASSASSPRARNAAPSVSRGPTRTAAPVPRRGKLLHPNFTLAEPPPGDAAFRPWLRRGRLGDAHTFRAPRKWTTS